MSDEARPSIAAYTANAVNSAAEFSLLKLIARASMVLVVPFLLWMGRSFSDKLDHTNELTIRLEERMTNITTVQIPGIATDFGNRLNAQAGRLEDHDRRIGKLEDWRNTSSTIMRSPDGPH